MESGSISETSMTWLLQWLLQAFGMWKHLTLSLGCGFSQCSRARRHRKRSAAERAELLTLICSNNSLSLPVAVMLPEVQEAAPAANVHAGHALR